MRSSSHIKSKGFTLIELLVVISIIGLLSTVVLAALNGARAKADVAAGRNFAGHTISALGDNNIVNFDFNDASLTLPTTVINKGLSAGTMTIPSLTGIATADDTDLFKIGRQITIASSASFGGASYTTAQITPTFAAANLNYSISAWYKPNSPVMGCPGVIASLVTMDAASPNGTQTGIRLTTGPVAVGFIKGPGSADISTSASPALKNGQWYHILFSVVNLGGGNLKSNLYLNGKSVGSMPSTASTLSAAMDTISVGSLGCGQALGAIDDVAFYSTYLTASNAEEMYAEGLPRHMLADAKIN
jgi:prepilin-type N-terminal cleavage/methylation domain-containing protein